MNERDKGVIELARHHFLMRVLSVAFAPPLFLLAGARVSGVAAAPSSSLKEG